MAGRVDFKSIVDEVVQLEIHRALMTTESMSALALDGYGPQAEMLQRPAFEALVTAWWASNHPTETLERYPLDKEYLIDLWSKARHETGFYPDDIMPEPLTDEERREAVRRYGRHGELPWTGVRFHAMAEELVTSSANEDAQLGVHLRAYLGNVQRFTNWMLHSSGLNFWRVIPLTGESAVTITLGPSDTAVLDALDMSWNLLLMAAGVYQDHFGVDFGPELEAQVFDTWSAFKGRDVVKALGRNDPCPCKSGWKFKECHGRLRR